MAEMGNIGSDSFLGSYKVGSFIVHNEGVFAR
jgi:hypothetical protein